MCRVVVECSPVDWQHSASSLAASLGLGVRCQRRAPVPGTQQRCIGFRFPGCALWQGTYNYSVFAKKVSSVYAISLNELLFEFRDDAEVNPGVAYRPWSTPRIVILIVCISWARHDAVACS